LKIGFRDIAGGEKHFSALMVHSHPSDLLPWRKNKTKETDVLLRSKKSALELVSLNPEQHFTKPPRVTRKHIRLGNMAPAFHICEHH
jgi:hypothetical protein